MKRFGSLVAVLTGLAGCASPLPGSESVVLTGNPDQVRGCTLIRQVTADQIWVAGPMGRDDIFQQFRNAAAEAGATHVLTLNVGEQYGGMITAQRATGLGELYRCQR